jgi:hypothetical protein
MIKGEILSGFDRSALRKELLRFGSQQIQSDNLGESDSYTAPTFLVKGFPLPSHRQGLLEGRRRILSLKKK